MKRFNDKGDILPEALADEQKLQAQFEVLDRAVQRLASEKSRLDA